MNDNNHSTHTRPSPDLEAFVQHARDDSDKYQAIAFDRGPARVLMQLEWDSRTDAADRAKWAFGYDLAVVGHMGGPAGNRRLIITDYFQRIREDGQIKVWHIDFMMAAETVREAAVDLSPEGFTAAFSLWQIHARDFLGLQEAFAVLSETGSAPVHSAYNGHDQRRVAARTVVEKVRAKWGLDPGPAQGDGSGCGDQVVA